MKCLGFCASLCVNARECASVRGSARECAYVAGHMDHRTGVMQWAVSCDAHNSGRF